MSKATLKVIDLRTDGGTQPRAAVDFKLVADYAEAMKEGTEFPPITAFYDGSSYWLADGFHRLFAAKKAERTEIAAEIIQGTNRDAVLHSFGVNETHGFRRGADDKRRAVIRMLKDDEWSTWSLNQIAKACRVSVGLVHKVFHDPDFDFSREKSTERKGADGRTINTANIGKAQAEAPKSDLTEFTRERYTKTYNPPLSSDEPDEAEVIYGEPDGEEDEPYIPPYVSNPHKETYNAKPLSNEPKPKEPAFNVAYTLLGKVQSMGYRTLIDGINSVENRTQEHPLENQINGVIEMLRGSLKQAEQESKTLEVVP